MAPGCSDNGSMGEIAGKTAGLRRILPNKSFTVSPESAQQRIVFRRFLTILQRNEQVVPGRFGRASFLGAMRPSNSRF
jgi:hypothetical protein